MIVKRVPLSFDWPLGVPWQGYENPWPGPVLCETCDGYGYNPTSRRLYDSFPSWSKKIIRAEIKELLVDEDYSDEDLEDLRAGNFNEDNQDHCMMRFAFVEIRAKRKNVWGFCTACNGEGEVPSANPAVVQLYAGVNLYEEWVPQEPPSGKGWQFWKEDAPESSVFNSPQELAEWLCKKIKIVGEVRSKEEWLEWVLKSAEAPDLESDEELTLPGDSLRIMVNSKPPPPGIN